MVVSRWNTYSIRPATSEQRPQHNWSCVGSLGRAREQTGARGKRRVMANSTCSSEEFTTGHSRHQTTSVMHSKKGHMKCCVKSTHHFYCFFYFISVHLNMFFVKYITTLICKPLEIRSNVAFCKAVFLCTSASSAVCVFGVVFVYLSVCEPVSLCAVFCICAHTHFCAVFVHACAVCK